MTSLSFKLKRFEVLAQGADNQAHCFITIFGL